MTDTALRAMPVRRRWTPSGPRTAGLSLLGLAVSLAMALVVRHLAHPFPAYDSAGYLQAAQGIRTNGLISAWPNNVLRTYAYPGFVAACWAIGEQFGVYVFTSVFVAQWVLLVSGAALVATSLTRRPLLRLGLFLTVAANPLVLVHCAYVLSDSLPVSLTLLAAGAIMRARRAVCARAGQDASLAATAWLAGAGAAVGFAVMTRPAAVPFVAAFLIALVLWVGLRRRVVVRVHEAIPGLVLLIVPLLPQLLINWRYFGRLSVFPTEDLSGIQARAGVDILRFATNVSGCGRPDMTFLNPRAPGVQVATPGEAARYYLGDWPAGPITAFLHVFSALDPRPFLTYVFEPGARYELLLQVLTVGLVVLAGLELVLRARGAGGWRSWRRWHERPGHVFLALCGLGALAVSGYSATEYRFGVFAVTCISLLAARGLSRVPSLGGRALIGLAIGTVAVLGLWFALSAYVVGLSPTWQTCT